MFDRRRLRQTVVNEYGTPATRFILSSTTAAAIKYIYIYSKRGHSSRDSQVVARDPKAGPNEAILSGSQSILLKLRKKHTN